MKNSFEWISISDMFAGIMMVFLLLAVTFMFVSQNQSTELVRKNKELKELNERFSGIMRAYNDLQLEINRDLRDEFERDFRKWNASIDSNNTIRFSELDLIFELGSSTIKPEFRAILNDFFPRYMNILAKYKNDIEEIIIEGHASNLWRGASDMNASFLNNAMLSSQRALSVLRFCFNNAKNDEKKWLMGILHANGMSFSHQLESEELSRRVEFRLITKAYKNIQEILKLNLNGENNV